MLKKLLLILACALGLVGAAHASTDRAFCSSTILAGDTLAISASDQYFATRLIQDATTVSDLRQGSTYEVTERGVLNTSPTPGTLAFRVEHLDGATATVFGTTGNFTPPASLTAAPWLLTGQLVYNTTQALGANATTIGADVGTFVGELTIYTGSGASLVYPIRPSGMTTGTVGWATGFATANSVSNAIAGSIIGSTTGNSATAMVCIRRVI